MGKKLLSLSPLVVFLAVYLVSSIVVGDFYKVPVSAAFLVAAIYAIIISSGSFKERITTFSKGAGNPGVLLMIWIFILAGAFASTAKGVGSLDATVALALRVIPSWGMYAGLFLTACFISVSVGTSVGTIVALVPLASGIAQQTGEGAAFMTAIIVGGAFFGDNLSFISDTTIASTRAAGCAMNEKFKANIFLALPAVLVVCVFYLIKGSGLSVEWAQMDFEWFKVIPYVLILVLSICGVNVSIALAIGIAVCAVMGLVCGSFDLGGLLRCIANGIYGMSELIIVTLLAGGMMEMIRAGGGLELVIEAISKRAKGRMSAEGSIAGLVVLANICTANNTIAILSVGSIAKDIADRFGISPRRTASLLDTFSCIIQGLLPYGAQILMASSLSETSGISIISYLYYPMALAVVCVASILFTKD